MTERATISQNEHLNSLGMYPRAAHWNLAVPRLVEEAVKRGEAVLASNGALVATTGQTSAQGQSESESSARLLVLNGGPAAQFDGGPRILRGSAVPPRAVAAAQDGLLGCTSRLWSEDGRLLASGTSKHLCRPNPGYEQELARARELGLVPPAV